jgi:hypothetical protein
VTISADRVTERPILFSAPMVRAILDGRKTQTRRVVKRAALDAIGFCTDRADEQPAESADLGLFYDRPDVEDSRGLMRTAKHPEWLVFNAEYPDEGSLPIGQGYGAVGDRLWVRETWAMNPVRTFGVMKPRGPADCVYRADGTTAVSPGDFLWTPSIHMPRAASRITLEITGVRVERLREISGAGAEAEGVFAHVAPYSLDKVFRDQRGPRAIEYFGQLWTKINGPASWAANPWVWVIEFKRIEAAAQQVSA